TQLCCGFSGRSESANGLEGIVHLDALLQLIVEPVDQAKRIAFIRFEESFASLLNMDDVHWDVEILKILHQSSMIVSGDFEQHLSLGEWHKGLDTVDEQAEPFTRILEGQSWAVFKTLMAGEQSRREEASDACSLTDIHADIQGSLRQ